MRVALVIAMVGAASCGMAAAGDARTRLGRTAARSESQSGNTERSSAALTGDPRIWFAKGQDALQAGDLDSAEADFRKVAAADPTAAAPYANLGVIAMRRKRWDEALLLLQKAEKLDAK